MKIAMTAGVVLVGMGVGSSGLDFPTAPSPCTTELVATTHKLAETQQKLSRAEKLLAEVFGSPLQNSLLASTTVTLTAYSATEAETNSEPYITADHTPSRIGLAAISRDLENELGLSLGQVIILKDFGAFLIADRTSTHSHKHTASPRPIRRTIDILHASPEAARRFGRKEGIKLFYLIQGDTR